MQNLISKLTSASMIASVMQSLTEKWETARKRKEKDFLEKESELEKEVQQERELHKEKEVQRRGKVKALKSAKSRVRRMLP